MGDWLRRWARERPESLAWADDTRRCSYAKAEERVRRLATWLELRGVGVGDRVAIWLGNRGAFLEVLIASARLGAIVLPINARLSPHEVAFQLEDSEPRLLLVEAAWRERAREAIALASTAAPLVLEVGECRRDAASPTDAYEDALAAAAPATDSVAASEDDAILLMYTSGTTGRPKGALLPYRKSLYNSLNAADFFAIASGDRVLVVAPLFHSLGLQILAIPALFAGAGLVLQEGFDAARVWRTIEREHISYLGGVPTMYQRLLDALVAGDPVASPPACLRFAFTAGAAAPVELIRAFAERGLLLKQGYGQTETSILTCLDSDRALRKAGSVGRPVRHAELRLIDPATIDAPVERWREVAQDEVGEIVVRGPITMLRYWRRPEATAETLRDGWLRTGDLATCDRDGDVTLVGRAREMFISGGENVYPAEVEAVLVEHPSVAEAAVVAEADARWGEVGCAHLVLTRAASIATEEIERWLRPRLAGYKHPKRYVFHTELPRTASGKVQKHRL